MRIVYQSKILNGTIISLDKNKSALKRRRMNALCVRNNKHLNRCEKLQNKPHAFTYFMYLLVVFYPSKLTITKLTNLQNV